MTRKNPKIGESLLPETGPILHCLSPSSRNGQTCLKHSPSWIPLKFAGILIAHHLTNPSGTQSDPYALERKLATHSCIQPFQAKEVREISVSGTKQRLGDLDHLRWRSRDKWVSEIPFKLDLNFTSISSQLLEGENPWPLEADRYASTRHKNRLLFWWVPTLLS